MARGGKESTEKGGQLTVADYTQRFLERTLENVLSDHVENKEESQKTAETNFQNLMHKLQEAGHKDDIRVPLRVLRDEIGSIYFHSSAENKSERIEVLFKLYDALERSAQEDARSRDSKVSAAGVQMLEELRQRFLRLVIGDTWDAWPRLKLLALKRMQQYVLAEKEFERDAASGTLPPTPTGRMGMRKLSRSLSGISSSSAGSWSSTMEELNKAPGSRLLPLIKLLLIDAEGSMSTSNDIGANGALRSKDSFKTRDSINSRDSKPPLSTQPSGLSEPAESIQRISVLEMDDLLGLNEPSVSATRPDPFVVINPSGGMTGPPTPGQPQSAPTQHVQNAGLLGSAHSNAHAQYVPYSASSSSQQSRCHSAPRLCHGHHSEKENGSDTPQSWLAAQRPSSEGFRQQSSSQQHAPDFTRTPHIQVPARADSGLVSSSQPGSFNPFELPSPTYSSRAPVTSDNNFADFSPVAGRPHAPVPNPMRSSGSVSPRQDNSAGFHQNYR